MAQESLSQKIKTPDVEKNPDSRPKAISAVTGGTPEDMNEMPPCTNPDCECTVYDGSDLSTPKSSPATAKET
jgi:hypothetical protein